MSAWLSCPNSTRKAFGSFLALFWTLPNIFMNISNHSNCRLSLHLGKIRQEKIFVYCHSAFHSRCAFQIRTTCVIIRHGFVRSLHCHPVCRSDHLISFFCYRLSKNLANYGGRREYVSPMTFLQLVCWRKSQVLKWPTCRLSSDYNITNHCLTW